MASIFNALHIGYSGLNAAQIGIDTTGHNISNAETEGYTRQRVVTAAAAPLGVDPGQRGGGTQVTDITRIFDSFVYARYTTAAQNKEYSDTLKKNLEELSTYFPEIDKVGIKDDLQSYYDMWQSLANNPSNTSLKVALAQQTQTLTQHIQQTRSQISTLQNSLNDQVKVNVDDINRIGQQIADLNLEIDKAESGGLNHANDLRDKRNQLELSLSKLIDAKVFVGNTKTNNVIDSNIAEKEGGYVIQVAGFNLVDGGSFHPIGIDSTSNKNGYNDLYYERQDGVRFPFANTVTGGKLGALLELRGSTIGTNGEFEDGFLQETINNLDSFAQGLIESTNNIYAQTATTSMQSNILNFSDNQSILSTDENFKAGTFDLIVYDIDGNEVGRRSISIDNGTLINDTPQTSNSIVGQINISQDDNNDNNSLNDIDDMLVGTFNNQQNIFQINIKAAFEAQGYSFAIEDHGTNFAGVTGVNRFFDGNDAKSIALNGDLQHDMSKIKGFKSPANGDNQTALDMVQQQFASVTFGIGRSKSTDTIYGYFDNLVTRVGTRTNSAIVSNDSITAQFNSIKQEQDSISKVSIDEEMANLIRYQTSYGAAAKVITTIDQMMTTLLGIKA
ncbi:flagellar hook-associated protein FlgK [Sulfuricurvum kujiense DSM 16994]|uniref:Flagellar hook-associated protein 1 n=1 Tax=Sulfuricurvum kujiense (strain ATCC BAA-921 / DSM 16994 / JCM 11577 / YK-1) TaxID=709032 RepID=E4U162_SULKY|nr:flagellar hook-associated protein FlgK [Sulfuricurvum kujiense]ADR33366.1 flagellar hook-associated protein FlgK [Sulfuricurvum kujiense DSM 16994]